MTSVLGVPASNPVLPDKDHTWEQLGKITYFANDESFKDVALGMARQIGIPVSIDSTIDSDVTISVELENQPAKPAFEVLCNWASATAVYTNGIIKVLPIDQAAKDVVFIRPGYELADDLVKVLGDFVGGGNVGVVGDRLAVSGTADVLERAERFRQILLSGPDAWRVDIRVVSISKSFRRAVGLSWHVGLGLGVDSDSGQYKVPLAGNLIGDGAYAFVKVLGEATESGDDASLEHETTLYVLEGQTVDFRQGGRVAIPLRTTSDQGTVTTTGVQYVETGFSVTVSATRVPGGVRLDLQPEISEVTGFVEEFPNLSTSKLNSSVILESGQWAVLSGLESIRGRVGRSGLPGLSNVPVLSRRSKSDDHGVLLFLVRATRVYSSGSSVSDKS